MTLPSATVSSTTAPATHLPATKAKQAFIALAVLGLASFGLTTSALAADPVKVGVIVSETGPIAFVGLSHKNSAALLPTSIGDTPIEYIVLDDGSDPSKTVRAANKLVSEHKIDALLGPSGSPNATALVSYMAESKTPMLAVVGTQAVVLPMDEEKRWAFKTTQNDSLMAQTLVKHMAAQGVKSVGFIGYNDSYGESWHDTVKPLLKAQGIDIIANERYSRNDSSVMGPPLSH